MNRILKAFVLALPLLVAACPQSIRGNGDDGEETGGDGGSTANSGGNDGGSDGGTVESGGDLAVSCARAGGATDAVLAGEAVEIDCTAAGVSGADWSVTTDPSFAYVSNSLGTSGKAWVTLKPENIPMDYPGGPVRVTIAASAQGRRGNAVVQFDAIGNVLVTVDSAGVAAYHSDGSRGRDFAGSTKVAKPVMLQRLADGSILVGSVAGAGTPVLRRFDRHGVLLGDFEDKDHSGNDLWAADNYPWAATQDGAGNVYVSKFAGAYNKPGGDVFRFTSTGSFLDRLEEPGDLARLQFEWVPTALAMLSDGTLVVGNGSGIINEPWVAIYPPGGTPRHVKLPFLVCEPGGGLHPSCRDNLQSGGKVAGLYVRGDEIIAAQDYGDGATLAAYTNPDLSFLRSTAFKDDSNEYGFWNEEFSAIAEVGNLLVVTKDHYGCPLAVDPVTLYTPANWRDQGNGCWISGTGTTRMRAIATLSP